MDRENNYCVNIQGFDICRGHFTLNRERCCYITFNAVVSCHSYGVGLSSLVDTDLRIVERYRGRLLLWKCMKFQSHDRTNASGWTCYTIFLVFLQNTMLLLERTTLNDWSCNNCRFEKIRLRTKWTFECITGSDARGVQRVCASTLFNYRSFGTCRFLNILGEKLSVTTILISHTMQFWKTGRWVVFYKWNTHFYSFDYFMSRHCFPFQKTSSDQSKQFLGKMLLLALIKTLINKTSRISSLNPLKGISYFNLLQSCQAKMNFALTVTVLNSLLKH